MASDDVGGVNELAKILVPSAPRVVADVAVDVLGGWCGVQCVVNAFPNGFAGEAREVSRCTKNTAGVFFYLRVK